MDAAGHHGFQQDHAAAYPGEAGQCAVRIAQMVKRAVTEHDVKRAKLDEVDRIIEIKDAKAAMRPAAQHLRNVRGRPVGAEYIAPALLKEVGEQADPCANFQYPLALQIEAKQGKMMEPRSIDPLGFGFKEDVEGRRHATPAGSS
jgi:hypothetical protein